MEGLYAYVNQKKMRRGITTGTCAAAAAFGAASLLFSQRKDGVSIVTPAGLSVALSFFRQERQEGYAWCSVKKDAGDDPDVTDGAEIQVRISRTMEMAGGKGAGWYEYQEQKVHLFLGPGPGVGVVTREGLSCPPGMGAINPVPREMIFEQVLRACREAGETGSFYLTVSVPGGEEIAGTTFNPRLGIEGGISVLGTKGIVEPMSQEALVETIRLEIRQRAAAGEKEILAVPGNYGERFLEKTLGISPEQGVKCSNFLGSLLDFAGEYGIRRILLIGHGGKLIKLAAGIMNTHSSVADGRMEILGAWAGAWGAGAERVGRILSCITVDEALGILEEEPSLLQPVMKSVMERIAVHLAGRAGNTVEVEAVLFTNERGIIGMTSGAEALIDQWKKGQKDGK